MTASELPASLSVFWDLQHLPQEQWRCEDGGSNHLRIQAVGICGGPKAKALRVATELRRAEVLLGASRQKGIVIRLFGVPQQGAAQHPSVHSQDTVGQLNTLGPPQQPRAPCCCQWHHSVLRLAASGGLLHQDPRHQTLLLGVRACA
jgi:hypothetical protein